MIHSNNVRFQMLRPARFSPHRLKISTYLIYLNNSVSGCAQILHATQRSAAAAGDIANAVTGDVQNLRL